MDKLTQWERIDAYHNGLLPLDEVRRVEDELATDAELRREAAALGRASAALQQLALDELVRQTVRDQLGRSQRSAWVSWVGRWLAAACVLMLLSAGYLIFSQVDLAAYRNDLTLTQRYRPGPENGADEDALTPAQRAFYRQFFDAQTYLATGQPRLAIGKLEALSAIDGIRPYFRDAIQWHLLNAYLLDNQPDNAEAAYARLMHQTNSAYPIDRLDRWKVQWQIYWLKHKP